MCSQKKCPLCLSAFTNLLHVHVLMPCQSSSACTVCRSSNQILVLAEACDSNLFSFSRKLRTEWLEFVGYILLIIIILRLQPCLSFLSVSDTFLMQVKTLTGLTLSPTLLKWTHFHPALGWRYPPSQDWRYLPLFSSRRIFLQLWGDATPCQMIR